MKIIITENQLKDKIHQMVKTEGWRDTYQFLGMRIAELAQKFFNNDPMEFLNLFNDLDVVQSKDEPNWTLFRYEPKRNLMVYDREKGGVFVHSTIICGFLWNGFDINYDNQRKLIPIWLNEAYNLQGVTAIPNDAPRVMEAE